MRIEVENSASVLKSSSVLINRVFSGEEIQNTS